MSERDRAGLRTLLVGLDGACLDVLTPLLAAGRLPTLEALFEAGVVGELASRAPPWDASAWPSLYTGVNPGKHGVFDATRYEHGKRRHATFADVREYALWELLDQRGYASVVVNVPFTAPPRSFDGALLPGVPAPDPAAGYPAGILDDVRRAIGDYRVSAPGGLTTAGRQTWAARLTASRGAAFRVLADRVDPDFGVLYFREPGVVLRESPGDGAAIRSVFEAVDDALGAVIDACDPDVVVVASARGVGPYVGYEFRVNDYLREHGFVATTTGETVETGLRAVVSTAARRVLAALGLDRFAPADTIRERVDRERSPAFARSATELGVRVNRAGRDPGGVVSPAEFPSIRDDIVRLLEDAYTPDGDPVFEEVVPATTYFHGPYVDDGVDVLALPRTPAHCLSTTVGDDRFERAAGRWGPTRDGLLVLSGDGVDTARSLRGAHRYDVAPTVLSTLGVPPNERMDGESLPPVDAVEPAEYAPFAVSPTDPTGGAPGRPNCPDDPDH